MLYNFIVDSIKLNYECSIKIQKMTLNWDKEILVATKTKKSGRPNIDSLLKRTLVEKREERKNGIIMVFGALLGIAILAIFFSFN